MVEGGLPPISPQQPSTSYTCELYGEGVTVGVTVGVTEGVTKGVVVCVGVTLGVIVGVIDINIVEVGV